MKLLKFAGFLATATLMLAGQQGMGPGSGPGAGTCNGASLDLSKVRTIEGTVSAVNVAYGSQYPSIQISQTTIRVAPVWYLLEHNFEIKAGDKLKVTAAPAVQNANSTLSAITITNTVTKASIALRDRDGVPLWSQMGSGDGMHDGTCTNGDCGLTQVSTATGTVEQVASGIGIQMPTLVLVTADGKSLTIKIGPERVLQVADFEIKAGDKLTVKYGLNYLDELVALELTNAQGGTLVLRNADCSPAWR